MKYAKMVDVERAAVIDSGCFNNFIAAYMVISMRCSGMNDEQISAAENSLHIVLDRISALEAVRTYSKFSTSS